MKILIIGPAYPYRGGLAAFNERMARQFVADGHEVKIMTFTLQYPSFLFPGKTQYSEEPVPSDLNITRSINSVNPFNWIRQGFKLRNEDADLAVVRYWLPFMSPCLGTVSRCLRGNGKTKVVALIDNMIPHERHFTDRLFSKYFVGSVDGFLYMSHSVGRDLATFDNRKPRRFSPHPVYDIFGEKTDKVSACTKLCIDADKKYVLFFGFIRDYKGLDLLMEAFADKLLREDASLRLIVAGEFYGNEEKYKALEKKLGLEGRILWFSEFIPDNKVSLFFSAADIVAQPYKSATQSGVTQVAYHFEKPMVVTDVGGLAEIVPDGKAGYVTAVDSHEIAVALYDFFCNKTAGSFAQGLRDEKKRYSWHSITEALIAVGTDGKSL